MRWRCCGRVGGRVGAAAAVVTSRLISSSLFLILCDTRSSVQKRSSSLNDNNGDGNQKFKQRKRDKGGATAAGHRALNGGAEIADDESSDAHELFRTTPGSFVCAFCNKLISVEDDEMAFVCDGATEGEECFCHDKCIGMLLPRQVHCTIPSFRRQERTGS